jgi:hypothetical protein
VVGKIILGILALKVIIHSDTGAISAFWKSIIPRTATGRFTEKTIIKDDLKKTIVFQPTPL